CLERGYLKEIIEVVNPDLIMILTNQEPLYKLLLKELLDTSYEDIMSTMITVDAQTRGGKEVKTVVIPCFIKNKQKFVLFLPHPNYRWRDDFKTKAIKEACNWMKTEKDKCNKIALSG
ncbi:MAG: hypothetical protein ACLPX5_09260, partial [Dissulfurispiraceae bacterium]